MNDKTHRITATNIIGTALVTSLASGVASAESNPFALKELGQGYQHVAEAEKEKKEMSCGEGKCGAQMMKNPEMKCGAGMQDMMKQQEAEKQKAMEAKCAGMTPGTTAPTPTENKTN
jgi:uncharacterized low-complexity protein